MSILDGRQFRMPALQRGRLNGDIQSISESTGWSQMRGIILVRSGGMFSFILACRFLPGQTQPDNLLSSTPCMKPCLVQTHMKYYRHAIFILKSAICGIRR